MDGFSFDFSQDKPRVSEPIPKDTKVLVRMAYTPGGVGHNGALTKSKETDAQYLKAEFTVQRGPYRGRKFFSNMTFEGGKLDEKGRSIAAGISRATVRSILDGSEGLSSKDDSPGAAAMRVLPNGFADLQGRMFVCKVGIEKGKDSYPDKNSLGAILTIDHKDYPKSEAELDAAPVTQQPTLPSMPAPSWGAPAATVKAAEQQAQGSALVVPQVAPGVMGLAQVSTSGGLPAWMQPAA